MTVDAIQIIVMMMIFVVFLTRLPDDSELQ